jgi:nucleotide-binding universal stress UspA family protein
MRSILVHADRGKGMTARLDTALAIARAHSGHVTLLIDTPVERFVTGDPFGGVFVATELLKQALSDDTALAEQVLESLRNEDVPYDVVQFELRPVEAFAAAGRFADLIVVSRDTDFAGDLALATRAPVLALGPGQALLHPPASVCIAWDGGEEAAAAMRLAVPLIAGAEAVHVLSVGSDPGEFPATDALRYLSRHGIKAELVELPRKGSIEETLLDAACERGADLLVMGAYSHTRMRELLFGGVTRFFLSEPTAPALFLAH